MKGKYELEDQEGENVRRMKVGRIGGVFY